MCGKTVVLNHLLKLKRFGIILIIKFDCQFLIQFRQGLFHISHCGIQIALWRARKMFLDFKQFSYIHILDIFDVTRLEGFGLFFSNVLIGFVAPI